MKGTPCLLHAARCCKVRSTSGSHTHRLCISLVASHCCSSSGRALHAEHRAQGMLRCSCCCRVMRIMSSS